MKLISIPANPVPDEAATAMLQTPDGVLLRSQADTLDWAAHYLMGLPWPVRVISPPELNTALRRLAARIDRTLQASRAALPAQAGKHAGAS